jgi:hypothetical protein
MSDYLSSVFTQNDSIRSNSQLDFNNMLDSQYESQNYFHDMVDYNKINILEEIKEEEMTDDYYHPNQPIQNIQQNFHQPLKQNKINEKIAILSQEIDNIDNYLESSVEQLPPQNILKVMQNTHTPVAKKHAVISNYVQNVQKTGLNPPSQDFADKSEQKIIAYLNYIDLVKQNICQTIDEFSERFKNEAYLIRSLIIADSEKILNEEERNKVIDQKMEIIFKELQLVLNEFNKIY